MRRSILLSLVVLGGVVTAVAGTGTFAPFTDRATSGPNSVASGQRLKAAELKIAYDVQEPSACAGQISYVDDSTSPGVQAVDAQPGYWEWTYFCLRNQGAATLTVSSTTIDVVDVDTACTGDEAVVDTSCGGNGQGELSPVLSLDMARLACDTVTPTLSSVGGSLAAPQTMPLGTLEPSEIGCYVVRVMYPQDRTLEDMQRAQSDTVSWKFAFDATT